MLSAMRQWSSRILRRLKAIIVAADVTPQRWHIADELAAVRFLVYRAAELSMISGGLAVLASAKEPLRQHPVLMGLRKQGIKVEVSTCEALSQLSTHTTYSCLICLDFASREVAALATIAKQSGVLKNLPFEYALVDDHDYPQLLRHDVAAYTPTHFRSPLLLDPAIPFEIYEDSLKYFSLKCDLRDFSELFQGLRHVVDGNVPGAVAEFGSFWGHSGYLIAQVLRRLASDKRLYMFDMFEDFPQEDLGIDRFWNQTHPVSFEHVKNKFEGLDHVTLIKGDFTLTLPETNIESLSLIFVDCDSYRGIQYLIETAYPKLSVGGLMIFEDYGHPALLGARLAVDEYFRHATGCYRFFSQFSGFYIVMKTSA